MVESETLSIGDLRAMIAATKGKVGMSKVNPSLPLSQTVEIFEAALEGRDDAEVPKAWRPDPYSHVGRRKPTRDANIVANILRDCGPPMRTGPRP